MYAVKEELTFRLTSNLNIGVRFSFLPLAYLYFLIPIIKNVIIYT